MKRIDNICQVAFIPITSIDSLEIDLKSQSVSIDLDATAEWIILDCGPGASLTIGDNQSSDGRRFTSQFGCSMRSELNDHRQMVLRIILEDGTTIIIGDLDLPVEFIETHELQAKALTFSHTSWHYPFQLEVLSESSSGSSGGL